MSVLLQATAAAQCNKGEGAALRCNNMITVSSIVTQPDECITAVAQAAGI